MVLSQITLLQHQIPLHALLTTIPSPKKKGEALITTKNGASGVYASGADLAYQQAIVDRANIIDCSVQMTKDGVAFYLNSTGLSQGWSTTFSKLPSRIYDGG